MRGAFILLISCFATLAQEPPAIPKSFVPPATETNTITGLKPGAAYYLAATFYDSNFIESDFSNEVFGPAATNGTIAVSWNSSSDQSIKGAFIYYGAQSLTYTQKFPIAYASVPSNWVAEYTWIVRITNGLGPQKYFRLQESTNLLSWTVSPAFQLTTRTNW